MTAIVAPSSAAATSSARPRVVAMTGGSVRAWLRLEGLAAFGAGLVLYGVSGGDWLFIVPLILIPDLSAIGYIAGPRVGALTYNSVHTWAPGFVALLAGVWLGSSAALLVAAALLAHVGMDRALGYGLKLPSSFQDTHLGRIGRGKS